MGKMNEQFDEFEDIALDDMSEDEVCELDDDFEDSSDYDSTVVNNDDLSYILGEEKKYTWDDFYNMMEKERKDGDKKCPKASYIALELLRDNLIRLSWRSSRTNSETHKDLIQSAYEIIAEHIPEFDRSQATFKTFIMKWFHGLARDVRNDGISGYQKKQGYNVVSTDGMKNNNDDGSDYGYEIVDENSSVEDVYEKQTRERSSELFQQMIGDDCETEDLLDEEKRKVYTTAACCQLFLGGIGNFSDDAREELGCLLI